MVDISTVSGVVAAASVVAGVVYYSFQLRNQTKVRQTDLVMRLYSTFNSKEFWEAYTKFMTMEFEDYNDYKKKYAPTGFPEKPEALAFATVSAFFHGVGILLYMKLIDINLTARLFPTAPIYTWEKMKPLVEGFRKERHPQLYAEYEYLYNEMQKRKQRLQPSTA